MALDTIITNNSANGNNPYDADLYGNSGTTTPPSDATAASNNTLTLGNGSAGPSFTGNNRHIYGGYTSSYPGNANNNTLTVKGGTSFDDNSGFYGGRASTASGYASDNTVTVEPGVTYPMGGAFYIHGGMSNGMASGNQVSVMSGDNGNFVEVSGGYSNGAATRNSVTIEGGRGFSNVYGGYSVSGDAGGSGAGDGNTVNITGGNAGIQSIYGGFSNSGGAALGNTVTFDVYSGTVSSSVYGGYSASGDAGGSGTGQGNTVNITGGTALFSGGHIYGGLSN
ncbi:MAG: hypothetical protein LBI87_02040, partial [Candidatus Accumulibacter sp.]|nr:hypothetical protein [Accumulibacter sp.]